MTSCVERGIGLRSKEIGNVGIGGGGDSLPNGIARLRPLSMRAVVDVSINLGTLANKSISPAACSFHTTVTRRAAFGWMRKATRFPSIVPQYNRSSTNSIEVIALVHSAMGGRGATSLKLANSNR